MTDRKTYWQMLKPKSVTRRIFLIVTSVGVLASVAFGVIQIWFNNSDTTEDRGGTIMSGGDMTIGTYGESTTVIQPGDGTIVIQNGDSK
jgi:hypothetical protein